MKDQQQQQQQQQQKPPPAPPPMLSLSSPNLLKLLSSFLLVGFGFAIGIITSFYLNAMSLPLQVTQLSLPPPPPPPPPPPQPSLPPPPPLVLNHSVAGNKRAGGLKGLVEPANVTHGMTDEELLWRASMVPTIRRYPYDRVRKVAFLFLTRGTLPFAPLWEKFFRGSEGLFSIYVHSDPGFNESDPEGSVFYGRRVPSKAVQWGNLSMMEAERRLLANALLDFSNQRFVLLSESCIPLFNFPTVYSYLMDSTKTFVEVYDDPGLTGRGRYNRRMRPVVKLAQWRKGSQWFEMDRDLALQTISDDKYYPVFRRHCTGSCYVDEHYLPTFVHSRSGWRNANRTLTWVDWSKGGPHPTRYGRNEVTVDLLQGLRYGKTCTYNGRATRVCFLFARKFLPNSLTRLLRFAPNVLGFGRRQKAEIWATVRVRGSHRRRLSR